MFFISDQVFYLFNAVFLKPRAQFYLKFDFSEVAIFTQQKSSKIPDNCVELKLLLVSKRSLVCLMQFFSSFPHNFCPGCNFSKAVIFTSENPRFKIKFFKMLEVGGKLEIPPNMKGILLGIFAPVKLRCKNISQNPWFWCRIETFFACSENFALFIAVFP